MYKCSSYPWRDIITGSGAYAAAEDLTENWKIQKLYPTHITIRLIMLGHCEDYKTYVGGDPKMLAESGAYSGLCT